MLAFNPNFIYIKELQIHFAKAINIINHSKHNKNSIKKPGMITGLELLVSSMLITLSINI